MPSGRQSDHSNGKSRAPRRSEPSPRIQALTNLYESRIAASGSRNTSQGVPRSTSISSTASRMPPVQHAALGQMDWHPRYGAKATHSEAIVGEIAHFVPSPGQLVAPSVRCVDARPTGALENLPIMASDTACRFDGLPAHSGTAIPTFPSDSPSSSRTMIEDPDTDQQDETMAADEEATRRKQRERQHIEHLASVRAVPAHEVFADDALPLHLPDLDVYLSDRSRFPAPSFTDPVDICSQQEADLFGLHSKSRSGFYGGEYEICGDQIELPRSEKISAEAREKKGQDVEEGVADTSSSSETVVEVEEEVPEKVSDLSKRSDRKEGQIFPPLMLLKNHTLDELKSNSIGPRKPPGGFIGSLPGCGPLLGTIVDFVIGVEGSTLAAGVFRLQMFIDFVQIMNLNLHFTSDIRSVTRPWDANHILLHVIPSAVSLDFVSIFGAAIIVLYALTGFVAVLLFLFWRMTKKYNPNRTVEGYASQPWLFRLVKDPSTQRRVERQLDAQQTQARSNVWTKFCNISVVVLLTVLYIPLSKLAVDALVWSVDYWPSQVDGAETTADMQGFCYRTSLNQNDFNWAFVILPVAALTIISYTLWFPFQMRRTIANLLPRVHPFNELGNRRTNGDLEVEYMRLLGRDSSPLNFMYNAYRRKWGTYKPLYILCFKLSNLLIIGIFTKQNCLFHTFKTRTMLVTQQSILIGMQSTLLTAHLFVQPFVDMLSNRSEMMSRIGYVSTAVIGLLVALQIEGSTVYQSVLLYVVQALTYSGNIYFSIAATSWMSHLIKRKQSRIDFSIDVFSPTLNLEKHIKRRIWHESLSTILLSGPDYRMPLEQMVTFSASDEWPPYLLGFQGTAAERHVENLKILKAVGLERYAECVAQLRLEGAAERWKAVMRRIQLEFCGVDAYWQPLGNVSEAFRGVSSFFGVAFLVPFPPTLVIRYDQSDADAATATLQLTTLEQLEMFVWQNESSGVQRRKWVRQVLRALDGQRVFCPHTEVLKGTEGGPSGLQGWLAVHSGSGRQYTVARPIYYEYGVLRVRKGPYAALGVSGGTSDGETGFDVVLTYTQGQRKDKEGMTLDRRTITVDAAAAFGLRDDFELTPSVDLFFRDNETAIIVRLPQIQQTLQDCRLRHRREAKGKRKTMDYSFLTDIFDKPVTTQTDLQKVFLSASCSHQLRHLPFRYPAATTLLAERFKHATRTQAQKWWYIFWDDFWRQNNGDYPLVRKYRSTFNPQYTTCIAYTPMPRYKLAALLQSMAGIWREGKSTSGRKGIFTRGYLNKIYFTLDEIVLDKSMGSDGRRNRVSGQGLMVGTMDKQGSIVPRSIATISIASDDMPNTPRRKTAICADPFAVASRYTGGGTDQDNSSIVERYAWPWTEERLSGRPAQSTLGRWKGKMLEWLSVRPYKVHDDTSQLFIYLRVVEGRYVAACAPSDSCT